MVVFNEGCQGIHEVIEYMGLDTGSRLITKSRQRDSVRVRKMVKKCSEKGKKRRKTLGRVKQGHVEEEKVRTKRVLHCWWTLKRHYSFIQHK